MTRQYNIRKANPSSNGLNYVLLQFKIEYSSWMKGPHILATLNSHLDGIRD